MPRVTNEPNYPNNCRPWYFPLENPTKMAEYLSVRLFVRRVWPPNSPYPTLPSPTHFSEFSQLSCWSCLALPLPGLVVLFAFFGRTVLFVLFSSSSCPNLVVTLEIPWAAAAPLQLKSLV